MAQNRRVHWHQAARTNLNPTAWLSSAKVKGFTDFVRHKPPERPKEPWEYSFDNKEMLLDTERRFIEAAKRNDVKAMKSLGRGINPNVKNVNSRTALHFAVAGQHHEAVALLLQWRVKVDQKDGHGVAPIHLAAWFGSLDMLKMLVRAGADQKICNNEGWNIIHCAAINNHTELLGYIVDDLQMKKLEQMDAGGNTPFALAANHGCVEMINFLMSPLFEMPTMTPNKNGDTPLHLACANGHVHVLRILLECFQTRDEVNEAGETALYLATERGHEVCVRALLQADCNPNIATLTQNSLLHAVAERGDTVLLRLLLDHNTQTDFQDKNLETPLHLSVKNLQFHAIHMLLESGCNINATDKRSQTVMHLAAEMANVDLVEMLLKAGPDLTICDKHEKTPLGVAARADEVVTVDMIIKAERYNVWKAANPELNEDLHTEWPLTFMMDHRPETKQFRSMVWHLTYRLLKPGDWKKLAEQWDFTKEQVDAIEAQWTGQHSYQEHGNRMLLIWQQTTEFSGMSPAKELYQGLICTSNKAAADRIRSQTEGSSKSCNIS